MPSEPDNRMDDLLKTYAKKRRDEAGAPFEMHPATRRLLQAEAAKQRPKTPDRSGSWFGAMLAFWPRLAVAASLVAVIGVTVWMFREPGQTPGAMEFAKHEAPAEDTLAAPALQPAVLKRAAEKPDARPASRDLEELRKENDARAAGKALAAASPSVGRGTDALAPIREETEVRLRAATEATASSTRIASESSAKQKAGELAGNMSEPPVRRNLQPATPAATPPPTAPPAQPVKPAVRLAMADAPAAPREISQTTPAKSEAKDKSEQTTLADGYLTATRTVTLGDELGRNQPASAGLQNNAAPSYFDQAPLGNAQSIDAGAAQLRAQNSLSLFANNVAPSPENRAQQAFGLATNSLESFYAINPNLGAGTLRYGGVNESLALAQNTENYRLPQLGAAGEPRTFGDLATRSDLADEKNPARQQNVSTEQNSSRFYRTATAEAQKQSQALVGGRFVQLREPAAGGPSKKTPDLAAAVLSNFVLEQAGERLRVVDADNSVYDGQLLAEQSGKEEFGAVTGPAAQAGSRAGTEAKLQQLQKRAVPAEGASTDSAGWNFRVSGMNRTLRQPVVLEGVLFETAQSGQGAQSGPRPSQSTAAAPPALPLQNGNAPAIRQGGAISQAGRVQAGQGGASPFTVRRIQGQVRIGATNQAAFDAVRSGN